MSAIDEEAGIRTSVVCGLMLVVGMAGCSDSTSMYPVTGTVKLSNGNPLPGGRILFQPVSAGKSPPARGVIAPDGSFELGTKQAADGAVPGLHKVVVFPTIPAGIDDDPNVIARHLSTVDRRYQSVETTPLEVTVKDDGSPNHFDLTVEGRGTPPG